MSTAIAARPPRIQGRKEGGYYYYGKRVCFLEHERGDEKYDRDRLEVIADNMNRRIERNIWCPAIIGHTSKYNRESDHGVVGYFGPYEVIDGVGPNGEAGIVAGQWSLEQYPDVASQYPRVSAEVWPSENILDPISLLGGTTPYFDMAAPEVPYQKPPQNPLRGKEPKGESQHYEMASPSGSNTYIPGVMDEEPDKYMGEGSISQLLQALKPQMEQLVKELVSEAMNISDLSNSEVEPESVEEEEVPADVEPGGEAVELETGESSEGLPAAGKADVETEPIKTSTGPDSMDDSAEFNKKYMRKRVSEFAQLEDGTSACIQYMATLEGEEKEAMTAVLSEDAPESEKEFYAKVVEDSKPAETEVEAPEKYARQLEESKTLYAKVQRERDEYKTKYEKAEKEASSLRKENDDLKASARYESRKNALNELAVEYAMDVDAELEDAVEMSDAQFERFKSKVKTNYQRVPDAGGIGEFAVEGDRKPDEKAERYAKLAGELGREIANKGGSVPYAKIRKAVEDTDGKVTAAELIAA